MTENALLWSEEFNLPEGSEPNSVIWERDLGDGTNYGIPGWGNNELQVYTKTNAYTNSSNQLELEARHIADGSEGEAYYGPATWSSARLVTKHTLQVQYGHMTDQSKSSSRGWLMASFLDAG